MERDESTSSVVVSPVRTSVSPVPAPGLTAPDRGCGPSSLGSFAIFDPESSSWKTLQRSLFEGSIAFSGIWPASGSMRSGRCFEHQTSERLTGGSESSSWPTQLGRDGKGCGTQPDGSQTLPSVVQRMWPTPTAGDAKASGSRNLEGSKAHAGVSLTDAVTSGVSTASRLGQPRSADGLVLNPRFVEAMMGFPDDHTACACSGIRSSLSRPRSRGRR
jgi:hypothetical protein